MALRFAPADAQAAAELHAAFESAFSDYLIGPFRLGLDAWPTLLARQAIELSLSRVALDGGQVMAFAFVARRDASHWRLATMGARPEARGSGAAPALLDELIARAASEGVAALELEVFAQNERALRLYRSRGFEPLHELHGYVQEVAMAPAEAPPAQPAIVERAEALAWLDAAAQRIEGLPLQVTPACLAGLPMPWTAWRQGSAQLVFEAADDPAKSVVVHGLVDTDAAQHDATALVAALCRLHAGRRIVAPQLQRLDVAGLAFRRAGFAALPLHQLLMVRPLSPPSSP